MTGDRTAASKDAGAAARKPATSGRSRGPDARFGLQDALGNRGVLDRLRRPAAAPVSVSPAGPGRACNVSARGAEATGAERGEQLMQTVGNRALQRSLPRPAADRISDRVTRLPGPRLQRACACGGECPNCLQTQRDGASHPEHLTVPPIVQAVLRSPGQPLGPATRRFMESRFGQDFGHVTVHTDARASESARAVHALAYTVGRDVVFASGRYVPDSPEGLQLIAHELTHVVQQGIKTSQPVSDFLLIDTTGEPAADRAAAHVMSGRSADPPGTGLGTSLQRQEIMPPVVGPQSIPWLTPETMPLPFPTPPSIPWPMIEPLPMPLPAPTPWMPPPSLPLPAPGPAPWLIPQTLPVPPVYPVPRERPEPDKDEDEEKDRRCGSPSLPHTLVSFFPGPLGQGGLVKASPLTRCPGNTHGSKPEERWYEDQFACIRAAGQSTYWLRGHILHGETGRTGDRNLHGPGYRADNLIIIDQTLNQSMGSWIERVVLDLVYGPRSGFGLGLGERLLPRPVLWMHAWVDSYHPGLPFFADSISVEYGPYDTRSGTEGPRWNFGQFVLGHQPPTCPAFGPAGGVFPVASPTDSSTSSGFQSTLQICHRELESRHFEVAYGGLMVSLDTHWVGRGPGAEAAGAEGQPEGCPSQHFYVELYEDRFGFDRFVSRSELTTSLDRGPSLLNWRQLDDGVYYLRISTDNDDSSCCLEGDITADSFFWPGRKSRPLPEFV